MAASLPNALQKGLNIKPWDHIFSVVWEKVSTHNTLPLHFALKTSHLWGSSQAEPPVSPKHHLNLLTRAWRLMFVIPVLGRKRWKGQGFKSSLGCVVQANFKSKNAKVDRQLRGTQPHVSGRKDEQWICYLKWSSWDACWAVTVNLLHESNGK